jgi:hypothetical protein
VWGQSQPAPVELIKRKVAKWEPGMTVEIKMVTKEKVKGKLVAANDTGIQVSPTSAPPLTGGTGFRWVSIHAATQPLRFQS